MIRSLALALALVSASALAAPPKGVSTELSRWLKAVKSGEPDRVAALLPEGAALAVSTEGAIRATPERTLDRTSLADALRAGQADALGLDRHLLLPRARDLGRVEGRWEARDKRCPEVRWIFERVGKRWRLTRIVRVLLDC
ncbi:MAG: hypothetical protein AMXMBFR64_41780 [Myxococcales bacterium]